MVVLYSQRSEEDNMQSRITVIISNTQYNYLLLQQLGDIDTGAFYKY